MNCMATVLSEVLASVIDHSSYRDLNIIFLNSKMIAKEANREKKKENFGKYM